MLSFSIVKDNAQSCFFLYNPFKTVSKRSLPRTMVHLYPLAFHNSSRQNPIHIMILIVSCCCCCCCCCRCCLYVIPFVLPNISTTPILSLIHISEPTRQEAISYAVFCLKKKNNNKRIKNKRIPRWGRVQMTQAEITRATQSIMLWYGIGRPVITPEKRKLVRFRIIRMAFGVRNYH